MQETASLLCCKGPNS